MPNPYLNELVLMYWRAKIELVKLVMRGESLCKANQDECG